MSRRPFRTSRELAGDWLAATLVLLAPVSANAQTDQAASASAKIFTPADFARFAPRTAYDMLTQVPGFTIRSADDTRGLGEASENVLINGQRVTDKSGGGATAQLRKVPADDVERIEIKEAASLGIAGLTGQVANVILKADRKASGTYSWSPQLRPHFAKPRWLAGSVNYSGTSGALGYTLSLVNNPGRGAMGGNDYRILSPDGVVIEKRDQVYWNSFDQARLSAILKYGGEGPVRANLNLAFEPYWNRGDNFQRRVRIDGNDNDWDNRRRTHGFKYDVGGDISVPLGGGRLKLIGLRRYEHAPATYDQRTDFDSGAPSVGTRYGQDSKVGETIGRLEYRWKGGRNDWTLSIERADNRLAQISTLASLQPDGSYADIPFPQGSGTVVEKRYEAIAALSRPLSSKLDLQLAGGAEYSELADLGSTEPARRFFRPKGSAALAWRPTAGWDASLKFERKVGQINFYDFLANQDITNDRENDANPNLVPPQSWELTGELGRNLGRWGKTRLKLYRHWVEDIVDRIPVGIDGDAVGNLPNATRWGMESISTIQFDPLGWKGAKLDAQIGFERSRVRDPLTGENRVISNTRDHWADVTLRHDIPGTQIAWGLGLSLDHYGLAYYLDEINQSWEGPYASAFIELKDVKGLKVNFQVFNLNDGHVRNYRTVYSGRRSTAPVSFYERQHQMVGPLFTLTVQGTF